MYTLEYTANELNGERSLRRQGQYLVTIKNSNKKFTEMSCMLFIDITDFKALCNDYVYREGGLSPPTTIDYYGVSG